MNLRRKEEQTWLTTITINLGITRNGLIGAKYFTLWPIRLEMERLKLRLLKIPQIISTRTSSSFPRVTLLTSTRGFIEKYIKKANSRVERRMRGRHHLPLLATS
jgi:hypothetical protein